MGAEYCYKDIVMEVDELNDDVMDVDLTDHMDVDSGDIEEYMSLQMSDTTSSCKFDRTLSKTDLISKRNNLGDVERSDFNNQRKVFEKKATDENSADVSVSEKIRNVLPNLGLLEDVANEKHFSDSINNSPVVNEETEKIKENNCSGSTITETNNLNINNDFMVKENKMLENTVVSNKANSETKHSEPKITGITNSQNKVYDSQENPNKNVTLESQNTLINCNKQNTSNNLISSHGITENISDNREKVNTVTDNFTYNNKVDKCAMNPAQYNNQTNILNNSNDSQNQSKEGHVSQNKAATELNVKENSGLKEALSNLNTSGESEVVHHSRAEYDGMEETHSESLQMVWYIIDSLLKNTFEKIEFINETSGVGNISTTALDCSQNSKVEIESQFLSTVPALSYLAKKILRENNVKHEKTQPLKLEKFSNYESQIVDSNSCEKLQNSVGDNSIRKEQSLKDSVQQKEISLSKKGNEKLGRRLRASLKRKEIREMKRESLRKARTTRHSLKESRKKIAELERSEKPVRVSKRNKQGKIAISKQIRELTIKKEICTGRGQRSRPQKKPLTRSDALKRSRRVDDDINKRSSRLRNKSVTGNSVKREPRTKSVRKNSPSPEHPPICEIFLETNFLEQSSSMFFNEDVDDGTSKKNIRTSSRMIKREGRFNPSVKQGVFSPGGSKFKRKLQKCVVKMERMPVIERLLPEKKSALDWDPSICELCEPKRLFLSKTALANHVNDEHINNSSTMMVAASPPGANTTSTIMKSKKPKFSSRASVPVSEKPPVNIPTLSTNTVVYKTRSKGAVEKPTEETRFSMSKRLKYVCDKCGRKFLSGAGLTSHKNRVKCDLVNSIPVQETDPLRNESFEKMTQGETAKAEFSVETKSNHKNGKIVLQFRRRQSDNRQSPPSKNLNNNNDDFADKMKPAYNNNEKNLHSQIKYVLRKKGPKKR